MSERISANSTLSHYSIISKIGAGGMGEVYSAHDTRLDRKVALKILPVDVASNRERMERFVREAKSAAALNHPNIATIHEIGESDGVNFIAMEFIDGETLRNRMQQGALKLVEVLDIAIQVAGALEAAHTPGIVHRDIKPENIMLRRDSVVKVLDFGLAKSSAQHSPESFDPEAPTRVVVNTEPGVVVGTALYMSPEQARGITVDVRTDIFSVGVVLYEMVAGRLPFEGSTSSEVLASILGEKEPQPLARYSREVPAELERSVSKALRKERERRYQSIQDLRLDLQTLKQQLDFEAKMERSIPPEQNSSRLAAIQPISKAIPDGAAVSVARVTSSMEPTITQIKRRKVAVIVAVLLLTVGGAWLGLFLRARNSEVGIQSIAVLPFQNKSANADSEYLSDGLAESLVYRLSQLPNLKVSPTSSAIRYKDKETDIKTIASELGVNNVMTGRIAQRGDDLTISVELVDVKNNKLLWGEQYERKMSDLLATQREIAAAITQRLQLKLAGIDTKDNTKRYTDNNDAYQLYLKGRFYFARRTKPELQRSIEAFEQAITLDPNFALAYVGKAESYAVMPSFGYMSPNEAMPQAKTAIAKALELDSELAEVHTILALIAASYDWNWAEAEREFKRAIELDPNLALAHFRYAWTYLSPMGRHEEAIAEMKRAMELEPLALQQGANYAAVLMFARQFDLAVEQAKKTQELDPSFFAASAWLAQVYNAKGMYAEAIALGEESLQSDPTRQSFLRAVGTAYAKIGRRSEAEAVIKQLKALPRTQYVMSYNLATIYAALGERDEALVELEKAYRERDWFTSRLKVDPFMDSLHGDPRFQDLVRRVGLQ